MRTMTAISLSFVVLGVILLTGCGSSPPPKSAAPPAVSAPPPPPAPQQPPVVSAPALGSPPANTTAAQPPAVAPPVGQPPVAVPSATVNSTPAPAPGGTQVKIGDAGKKDFGGGAILKPITVPMQVYSMAKWKAIEFTVQSGLNSYTALNGHPPKTEKDFFSDIIKANQIDLPKLKDGERYVFDVEQQQLMVEKPAE